jgi:WD40 repeat protein
VAELPEHAIVGPAEDDDRPGAYAVNPDDARLPDQLRGAPAATQPEASGELGCFRISPADAVISCLACAPDNRHALAALDDQIFVLDLAERRILRSFKEHDCRVRSLVFSPNGKLVLSGDESGGLALWEVAGGRAIRWLEGHERRVDGVAYAPDAKLALSGGDDGLLILWDLTQGKELACLDEGRHGYTRVVFSANGQLALSGDSSGVACLWDVANRRLVQELPGPALGSVTAVAFTPDGLRALAAGSLRPDKGAPPISQWEVASGRRLRTQYDSNARGKTTVTCTAFAPDGWRALAGGGPVGVMERRGTQFWYTPVCVWNIESGVSQKTFRGHLKWKKTQYDITGFIERQGGGIVTDHHNLAPSRFPLATITCVGFTPDGRRALSGANDGTVRIWGLG